MNIANPEIWIVSILVNVTGWILAACIYLLIRRYKKTRESSDPENCSEGNKLHGGG